MFIGRTDVEAETPILWATWCEELTHWKRPWCWERLKVGGEGDDRGWDGWMASLTQWIWVWVNSSSWWWTGRPGVLWSMGSQRDGHDWANELNWTETAWDRGTFAAAREPGKTSLPTIEYKGTTAGTKHNYTYVSSWGKIWTRRYTERPKNATATSEELGRKAGHCACPLTEHHQRGGQTLRHPQPDPWTHAAPVRL